jgi:hypothetical protein
VKEASKVKIAFGASCQTDDTPRETFHD